MSNVCVVCGKEFQSANSRRIICSVECNKEYHRQYNRRYIKSIETKERQREYMREYNQRPEVKERYLKYNLDILVSILRQNNNKILKTEVRGQPLKLAKKLGIIKEEDGQIQLVDNGLLSAFDGFYKEKNIMKAD